MGYLNKKVRRLEEEGYKLWLMESQADWIKTRHRLASLFSDFALSKNDKIKVWTGYRVATEHIRMSLTELGILSAIWQRPRQWGPAVLLHPLRQPGGQPDVLSFRGRGCHLGSLLL